MELNSSFSSATSIVTSFSDLTSWARISPLDIISDMFTVPSNSPLLIQSLRTANLSFFFLFEEVILASFY